MALNDISLTAGMRNNLGALQNTSTLLDRTQSRLATGKKVNTALDNPTNFFAAQNHTQRAADLTSRKDGMAEAIQGVTAADKGISGVTALIEAARGLTQSARSADAAGRENLAAQFNLIRTQIDSLSGDAGYKGKNFLAKDTLNVLFNENGGSSLTIAGFDGSASGLSITAVSLNANVGITTAAGEAALVGSGTTATVATGSTLTIAGVVTGTVNIASVVHTATLAASVNTIAASNIFHGANAVLSAASTGMAVVVDVSGLTTGGGTLFSSGATITAAYLDGNAVTGAALTLIQTNYNAAASGGAGTGLVSVIGMLSGLVTAGTNLSGLTLTGASLSFDIAIKEHLVDGGKVTANMVGFDLKAGDQLTGLSGAGAAGAGPTSGSAGITVFVDGVNVATGSFTMNGSQITFAANAVPPSGTVTYQYNSGLASGARSQDTTTAISGGTAGLLVYLSGSSTALTQGTATGNYSINGQTLTLVGNTNANSSVTFSTASATGTTAVLATGVANTSTITNQSVFTATETMTTGHSIISVSVSGSVVAASNYTVTGSTITFKTGNVPTTGQSITYTVQSSSGFVAGAWSTDAGISASVSGLDAALSTLRTQSAALASNLNVVATRQDFTAGMINTLSKGADNLTLADMNEEGANMLMLQTRQQLSTTSLKMASDAAQAVLRLF